MTQQTSGQHLNNGLRETVDFDAWFVPASTWPNAGRCQVEQVSERLRLSDFGSSGQALAGLESASALQLFHILPELHRAGVHLSERVLLLCRVQRLAFAIVEAGDVLPFAAAADSSPEHVRTSLLQLTQMGEDEWLQRSSTQAKVVGGWIPALSDATFQALRRLYISCGETLCNDALVSDDMSLTLDAWLWLCVDAFVRMFHQYVPAVVPPLEEKPGYRIPYRGEKELMDAWRTSLFAPERGESFSADPWLLWRTLRQIFAGSGWTEEGVHEPSGRANYHLEFELLAPARNDSVLDWRLRYLIVHNHFGTSASLSDWWETPTRILHIGRDRLVGPESWFLPELLAAGRACPPIMESLEREAPSEAVIPPEGLVSFLGEHLPKLQEQGYRVRTPNVSVEDAADVRIRVQVKRLKNRTSGVSTGSAKIKEGWFEAQQLVEFDWSVVIDDEVITREEFEQMVARRTPYIQLGGSWRLVPLQEILSGVQALQQQHMNVESDAAVNLLELSRAVLMNEAAPIPVEVSYEEEAASVRKMLEALCRADRPELLPSPVGFHGSLRAYQHMGFSWLVHLRDLGIGGCLADDMGLGKTIQVLAYFMHIREAETRSAPHLLICPTSLLQNWRSELHRFTPDLKVYVHHGPRRNDPTDDGVPLANAFADADVVMTTYATVVRDIDLLSSYSWRTLVIDEAQNIKNAETKQAASVRMLPADHRIALTGTPVENRLEELWAIMDFLNPGYLGSGGWFRRMFAQPIMADPKAQSAKRLQLLLQPVLLRRRKTDPAIQVELPEKWEVREHAALTSEQAALYQSIINRLWTGIEGASSDMSRRGQILAALVRLKQLCDHPCLVTGGSSDVRRSGKLKLLLDLVADVVDEGESALIFTQFRDMGEMLSQSLQQRFGWQPKFLHGGLTAAMRGEIVDAFQSGADPSPVLVLSLKAGGVGLNLTRANHVFHFDRWWNPAVEDQATDRAFRIGQTRDVQVHKLVCSGTLEDRIDELIFSKRALSAAIVGQSEGWLTEMDNESLRSLLALDADAALEDDEG